MVLPARRLTVLLNFIRDESKNFFFPLSLSFPSSSPSSATTEATSANKWQRHLAADPVYVCVCARLCVCVRLFVRARVAPMHLAHSEQIAQKQKFQQAESNNSKEP